MNWTPEQAHQWVVFVVFAFAAFCIYFLPTIVAQNPRDRPSIFVINLFLGWTFLGWVLALAWACRGPERETTRKN